MELKVWVEGIQRIICGVTEATTCQDVVQALALATGKKGRFKLIEKWRNNERMLSPHENPLKILMKWGEYSNDVQFIMRRSEEPVSGPQQDNFRHNFSTQKSSIKPKENIKKSLTFSGAHHSGVPNTRQNIVRTDILSESEPHYIHSPQNSLGTMQHNLHERASLHSRGQRSFDETRSKERRRSPVKTVRPETQPLERRFRNDVVGKGIPDGQISLKSSYLEKMLPSHAQYEELLRLVNLQREKLNGQDAELTRYDAEITYWEERYKDYQRQLDHIHSVTQSMEMSGIIFDSEIRDMDQLHLQDEYEIGKQTEKTLQSELTLLRSKLANCETELLQCKNKIRLLSDQMSEERRHHSFEEQERQERERIMIKDMSELQDRLSGAIREFEQNSKSVEELTSEVTKIESAITKKNLQLDEILEELREANLETFVKTPTDLELGLILEGERTGLRPGSARKIIGSPRQLENAVPTHKNPQGMWV